MLTGGRERTFAGHSLKLWVFTRPSAGGCEESNPDTRPREAGRHLLAVEFPPGAQEAKRRAQRPGSPLGSALSTSMRLLPPLQPQTQVMTLH